MGKELERDVQYTVEQLVAVNPYNPDILPDLENYVNEQVSSQTYSLDANLCLLRLYQFEPERMSTQIVSRILQMEEQFKTLILLSHYLETGRFRQFWDEAAKNRHIVEAVPGFEQAVQAYAIHVLSLTYQKVPRSVLAENRLIGLFLDEAENRVCVFAQKGQSLGFKRTGKIGGWGGGELGVLECSTVYRQPLLGVGKWRKPENHKRKKGAAINIEGLSLDKFLEHQVVNSGWILDKGHGRGQLIILPRNEFNHPELKQNTADSVPFEHITRIFPILG
ncbi:Eukaryotic translation initiation factor 3 subunit K [Morella rubra]|uniref:Eukaryotic translation initiation factor 3 subunit K n=1 Tax=Morella rubra TaxID=262757 RepID=A0A6A1W4T6_9ROSI|nr:Eukaryotic translation initiation factor 3 subunit K [Morella rubra]